MNYTSKMLNKTKNTKLVKICNNLNISIDEYFTLIGEDYIIKSAESKKELVNCILSNKEYINDLKMNRYTLINLLLTLISTACAFYTVFNNFLNQSCP